MTCPLCGKRITRHGEGPDEVLVCDNGHRWTTDGKEEEDELQQGK